LRDHDICSRMGVAARQIIEQDYSLHLQVDRYLTLYQQAQDEHRARYPSVSLQ